MAPRRPRRPATALSQGRAERLPDHQQLGAGRIRSSGANLTSTLGQLTSASESCIGLGLPVRHVSTRRDSAAAWAPFQLLVDSNSMRCASSTAASRWTMAWFCRSSITFTRSDSAVFNDASGSRDSGAHRLWRHHAARPWRRRCSGEVSPAATWPRVAQSAASASWVLARRRSSSFSRRGRPAPLSLTLSSLKTSCINSGAGAGGQPLADTRGTVTRGRQP
jgi:hypothetical protein